MKVYLGICLAYSSWSEVMHYCLNVYLGICLEYA